MSKKRIRQGVDFPNIALPPEIAALKTVYQQSEVSLVGLFHNVLQTRQYYRNTFMKIYGRVDATHRDDKAYYRLFNFVSSDVDYKKYENPQAIKNIVTALKWFKQNNPHYKKFYSNYETLFHSWNKTNPVEIFGGINKGHTKLNLLDKFRSAAEPNSMFFTPADDIVADDEEMISDPNQDIAAIQHPIDPIRAKATHDIIQSVWVKFSDFDLHAKTFPHLFPFGFGSYKKDNKLYFTFRDWCKMRLLNVDPRWRNSDLFKFFLMDIDIRERIYYFNKETVKTADVKDAFDDTAGKIRESKNKSDYEQLGHRLPARMPGSKTFWLDKMSNLLAMNLALGAPDFFVTLTQNDASPEIQAMFKEGEEIFQASQHGFLSQPVTKKGIPIVDNALESVMSMHKYVKAFIKDFLKNKEKSPFGENIGYFVRAEYQQRGAVHYHILIWSKKGTFSEHTVVCAEMPRGEKDEYGNYDEITNKMREIVKLNIHKCSNHCNKRIRGKPIKKGQKHHCKYGFPFALTHQEYLEESGKRYHYVRRNEEDRNVVPYNMELLVHGYRHCNVQKVGPEMNFNYICKYITKPEKAANVKLPAKAGNVQKFLARRVVSAPEASAYLIQIWQCLQSHEVVFLMTEIEPKSRVIKRYDHLPVNDNSTDIYYQTKFEKYLTRPQDLLELTYLEFYQRYKYLTDHRNRMEPRPDRSTINKDNKIESNSESGSSDWDSSDEEEKPKKNVIRKVKSKDIIRDGNNRRV